MLSNLFQTFAQTFETSFSAGTSSVISSGLSAIAGPLTALLVIYVIVTGLLASCGEFTAGVALRRVLRAGGVSMLLTATYFNQYVTTLFLTTLPGWIAQALAGGSTATTIPQQCDALRSAMEQIAGQILQRSSWTDIDTRLMTALCTLLGTTFLGVGVLIYEIARAFLGITVTIGPFILAGWLFEASKPIVEAWIGKLIALTILELMVAVTAQVVVQADTALMHQAQTSVGNGLAEQVQTLGAIIVFFGLMSVVMIGLPSIAYSIGRGVALNTGAQASAALLLPWRTAQRSARAMRAATGRA